MDNCNVRARKIGVISDTHGLVREEVLEIFKGCDLILHAGDIGKPEVIETLRNIAPIYAVRGNVDKGKWADELPVTEVVEVEGVLIYMIHNINEMDLDPKAAGFEIVIYGHSHKHSRHVQREVLYLNPGSAGPKRFKLPITVALLNIRGQDKEVNFIELK